MTAFKMEIADDLGLLDKIDADGSFKMMSTVEVGQIGGEMVRRIQAAGEYAIKQRYEQGMARLMPEEVLPNPKALREMTNNGNPSVQHSEDISKTPGSGQQWEPGTSKQADDTEYDEMYPHKPEVRYAPAQKRTRAVDPQPGMVSQVDMEDYVREDEVKH